MSWSTWARTARAEPVRTVRPGTLEQLVGAVRDAARDGLRVKAVGSGHSFTAVAVTDGVLVDLAGYTGLVSADQATGACTVRAGTTLRQLNGLLAEEGLAMTNLGDIDAQTVAGAISTGTHGTGVTFGGLSTQVRALELVMADGSVVTCSAEVRPELFAAARVGLGALGVISTVTLQCEPAFLLRAEESPMELDEVLARLDELVEGTDHFEFYWFPNTTRTLVKRNHRLPADSAARPNGYRRPQLERQLLENTAFGLLCRAGRRVPRLVPRINTLSTGLLSPRTFTDRSDRVFVTPRRVRFVEMEYGLPREAVAEIVRALPGLVERLAAPVAFPVEVRFAAADDLWLSTASGRQSAYVAVHQFVGMPYQEYFGVVEALLAGVGGRPHWGKLHTLDAEELRPRYPRFGDFLRVRDQVDPGGRFRNVYLDRVLGPPTRVSS